MSDIIDRIKESVSCFDFADHIGLKPDRKGFCCCPFHGEKAASLKIYPDGKSWYCFGCCSGGDVISMARKYYKLGFKDTLQQIASDFGLIENQDADLKHSNALLSRVEIARRKSLAEKEKELKRAKECEYWRLFDLNLKVEDAIMDYAPVDKEEEFDERFVLALKARDEIRNQLEKAEERRNNYNGSQRSNETARSNSAFPTGNGGIQLR